MAATASMHEAMNDDELLEHALAIQPTLIDLTTLPPDLQHDPLLPDALLLRARYLPHPWYEEQERRQGLAFWTRSIRSKINLFRKH